MARRQTITAVDVHAAGEPGRILLDAHLLVRGSTMAQRLQYCRENLEWLRRLILREPRGYPGLCAALVLPPVEEGSDFGMIVLEQGGFTPMSGSNLICAVTAVVETQAVPVTEPVTHLRVDTAAGTVEVAAAVVDGLVTEVTFQNVPAFVVELDHPLDLPEYGQIEVDVVFGGQFFVQARAEDLGLQIHPANAKEIVRAASLLRAVAAEQITVSHPAEPSIDSITLPMLFEDSETPGVDGRNAVVLSNAVVNPEDPATWLGALDRSPCGTGTCGRMAARHARGELDIGQPFVHQSILGTTFTGQLRGATEVAGRPAVLPSITGRGWVTGFHQFVLDSTDPFPEGYVLGDIWGPEAVSAPSP